MGMFAVADNCCFGSSDLFCTIIFLTLDGTEPQTLEKVAVLSPIGVPVGESL